MREKETPIVRLAIHLHQRIESCDGFTYFMHKRHSNYKHLNINSRNGNITIRQIKTILPMDGTDRYSLY